ncbi:MAG TPA: DNA gyrase modulator, partial [Gammaproteobacteria bacterium]|nr:DNA gyrase modulator [Gammaproteobacteria bacterium]
MIKQLLQNHKITKNKVFELISSLSETGGEYCDLYFQHSVSESWLLDDGIVKDGSYNISHGVGTRCVKDDKTGFAYSDDLNIKAIQGAIDFAKGISDSQKNNKISPIKKAKYTPKYLSKSPLDSLTSKQKVNLLRKINSIARKDPKVTQVSASLAGAYTEVLIASSDGVYQMDCRPMVRLTVSVIVEYKGRVEQGSSGGGGRYDYGYFVDNGFAEIYTKEAVRLA